MFYSTVSSVLCYFKFVGEYTMLYFFLFYRMCKPFNF